MQGKDNIQLTVLSPEKTVLQANVSKVVLPATKGQFMVLYNHAPVITSLEDGTVIYETEGRLESLEIYGGFAEVNENIVTICAEV
jgi:F-type H+-transporting ATPase subunit epsilon